MRLIDADAVKKALRNRISENIDECINNVPTVDVLDKIRAEITDMPKLYPFVNHIDTYVKEDDVLAIIDKYRKGANE